LDSITFAAEAVVVDVDLYCSRSQIAVACLAGSTALVCLAGSTALACLAGSTVVALVVGADEARQNQQTIVVDSNL
jgi:hypothetical protein